eukprot:CAMPEP_0184652956 /NCGR_PEP_ID=MMETSP0308-20130426/10667_1 /TAXON_ID=38269 /ORGANISM="Gloeochaete witrockiana, Strain SAG 46.84" /LENGTH=191 /DNA_ID=CAMNT_0027088137 /DNA_START=45 /DNA_END=620 /DNA_ORIENTATION=-
MASFAFTVAASADVAGVRRNVPVSRSSQCAIRSPQRHIESSGALRVSASSIQNTFLGNTRSFASQPTRRFESSSIRCETAVETAVAESTETEKVAWHYIAGPFGFLNDNGKVTKRFQERDFWLSEVGIAKDYYLIKDASFVDEEVRSFIEGSPSAVVTQNVTFIGLLRLAIGVENPNTGAFWGAPDMFDQQ